MTELQIMLTAEERECLGRLLETSLKDTRIESHRTRTPTYREHLLNQENLIVSLLTKLGQAPK